MDVDFFIAGFPKCGTTTLLRAFANHNETAVGSRENCDLTKTILNDTTVFDNLNDELKELAPGQTNVKRGIKCPSALFGDLAINRLEQYSPDARLIIGVRHPVDFLQSFYNYRISEIYNRIGNDTMPPIPRIETLVVHDETNWRGVSTESARYERFLVRLGKTNAKGSNRTSFKVFMYSLEQMGDTSIVRRESFSKQLAGFLGLNNPLEIGHENRNYFVETDGHKETIDICKPEYNEIREYLLAQAQLTERWIRRKFLQSPDVTVANKEHFIETIQNWNKDPCKRRAACPVAPRIHKRSTRPGALSPRHLASIKCPIVISTPNRTVSTEKDERIYLVGLGLDATQLKPQVLSQLLQLNCEYGVNILASSRHGIELAATFVAAQQKCYGGGQMETNFSQCGSINIEDDPSGSSNISSRLTRIAYLRDNLRATLKAFRGSQPQTTLTQSSLPSEAVILVDLDLYGLPSNSDILAEAYRITRGKDYDVICAAGLMHHPFGYYDIFATVFEDGTFAYPVRGRRHPYARENETTSLIRSDSPFGSYTQKDMFQYLEMTGAQNQNGIVPVRSCFGGLAVYRLSTFLRDDCNYSLAASDEVIAKYYAFANVDDGLPCEHIIFHGCLTESQPSATIGIQSKLITWWDEPYHLGNTLVADGRLAGGFDLRNDDIMVWYADRPQETLFLRNGNFRFLIDQDGSLVIVEDDMYSANLSSRPTLKWRLALDEMQATPQRNHTNVEYAFLTLENSGVIVLTYQFRLGPDKKCVLPAQITSESVCRQIVWRSETQQVGIGKQLGRECDQLGPVLHLGKDGVLRVIDVFRQQVVWDTSDSVSNATYIQEILNEFHKPHTRETINEILTGSYIQESTNANILGIGFFAPLPGSTSSLQNLGRWCWPLLWLMILGIQRIFQRNGRKTPKSLHVILVTVILASFSSIFMSTSLQFRTDPSR